MQGSVDQARRRVLLVNSALLMVLQDVHLLLICVVQPLLPVVFHAEQVRRKDSVRVNAGVIHRFRSMIMVLLKILKNVLHLRCQSVARVLPQQLPVPAKIPLEQRRRGRVRPRLIARRELNLIRSVRVGWHVVIRRAVAESVRILRGKNVLPIVARKRGMSPEEQELAIRLHRIVVSHQPQQPLRQVRRVQGRIPGLYRAGDHATIRRRRKMKRIFARSATFFSSCGISPAGSSW